MLPLYEAHRPKDWSDVVGQDEALRKIDVLRRRGLGGQVFWITGPSGAGKTTIARLIAAEVTDPYAIVEIDAQRLTLDKLRELDRSCHFRPLTAKGKGYHCFIVNESHKLNTNVVSELQTVLESEHVMRTSTWVFTTTDKGHRHLFGTKFDAIPFLSRAKHIELRREPDIRAMAVRAKQIAEAENLDGQPIERYEALARKAKGNLRTMLNVIEAGAMCVPDETDVDLDALLAALGV